MWLSKLKVSTPFQICSNCSRFQESPHGVYQLKLKIEQHEEDKHFELIGGREALRLHQHFKTLNTWLVFPGASARDLLCFVVQVSIIPQGVSYNTISTNSSKVIACLSIDEQWFWCDYGKVSPKVKALIQQWNLMLSLCFNIKVHGIYSIPSGDDCVKQSSG